MYESSRLAFVEFAVGAVSIGIGVLGYFLDIPQLELLGIMGTILGFGLLIARIFPD